MYQWGPYNDLWGIQYKDKEPGAVAMEVLQDWIVGSTYLGCREANRKVTCNFSGKDGRTQVIYSEKGVKSFKVKKQYKQMCTLDGECTAVPGNRKVRTFGPVLLKK